jgi:hypothetical protein
MSYGSWISKVTAWVIEVQFLEVVRIFLFVTTFRLTLGPSQLALNMNQV